MYLLFLYTLYYNLHELVETKSATLIHLRVCILTVVRHWLEGTQVRQPLWLGNPDTDSACAGYHPSHALFIGILLRYCWSILQYGKTRTGPDVDGKFAISWLFSPFTPSLRNQLYAPDGVYYYTMNLSYFNNLKNIWHSIFGNCVNFCDNCSRQMKDLRITDILKHLKEFVQSDWFLPVFISHDRDTARGALWMFHAHAPGPGLIH